MSFPQDIPYNPWPALSYPDFAPTQHLLHIQASSSAASLPRGDVALVVSGLPVIRPQRSAGSGPGILENTLCVRGLGMISCRL